MRLVAVLFGCLLIAMMGVVPPATAQTAAGTTLFEGARLITGEVGPPIENSAFLVENGRFTRVGRKGEVPLPAGATRVDLTGKTVIPGLIDAHTHVGYEKYANLTSVRSRFEPVGPGVFDYGPHNFTRENILDHMSRYAYFGVAAVWSAGYEIGELPYQLRDEILAGKHPNAARYYPSGPGLTTPGMILADNSRQSAWAVTTEEEARTAVRKLAAWKITQLKLWVSANPAMSPVVYRAIIDEAHKHNIRVGIHPFDLADSKEMLRAGLDIFLHPVEPDEEFLKLVREHRPYGTMASSGLRLSFHSPYTTPAHPLLRESMAPFQLQQLQNRRAAPEAVERSRAGWDRTVEAVKALRAAGMRFGMGADGGGASRDRMVGWVAHVEMENMVAAGFTPAEVIVAATKTSAEILRLNDLGVVAPGKEAAFVVLDANPLDDITNTRTINAVYLRGQEVGRAGLRAAWAKTWPAQ